MFANSRHILAKTFMCKWCGTRYCKECGSGDYAGKQAVTNKCRKCNHPNCQGQRVEFAINSKPAEDDKNSNTSKKGGMASSQSPAKSAKSSSSSARSSTKSGTAKTKKKKK